MIRKPELGMILFDQLRTGGVNCDFSAFRTKFRKVYAEKIELPLVIDSGGATKPPNRFGLNGISEIQKSNPPRLIIHSHRIMFLQIKRCMSLAWLLSSVSFSSILHWLD